MPKVVPPSNPDEDWLLWYQYRDENFAPEIVRLSTGRIAFAKSKDGLTNWNPVPVLGPNKESGDWFVACFIVASFTLSFPLSYRFYFDSEHVGIGDVIQPGRNAQLKFTDQGNVFLMYIFGGNGDSSVFPSSDGSEKKVIGSRMEIGVAVSRDGENWSR